MSLGTVAVFGATSVSGEELCRRLHGAGHRVVAVARETSDTKALKDMGVEVRTADVLSRDQVVAALDELGEAPAVATVLGGGLGQKTPVDSTGTMHVIDVAKEVGAERFVMVTSIGCGDSKMAPPWLARVVLAKAIKNKNQAEAYLQQSDHNWTIIRPGNLRAPAPTGHGILVEDSTVIGSIHRVDLGALIEAVLTTHEDVSGKIFAAVDRASAKAKDGSEVVPVSL